MLLAHERAPEAQRKDGIAVAVLLDTSGSMDERVRSPQGDRPKIEIAREAAAAVVGRIAEFAQASDLPVEVGIFRTTAPVASRIVSQRVGPTSRSSALRLSQLG